MNKDIMKLMYVPLNVFRIRVMRTGIVTPKVEGVFTSSFPEYSNYKDEVHLVSTLGNAHGWMSEERMRRLIDGLDLTIKSKTIFDVL